MVIRLCFGGRRRGGRIAYARSDAARGRNSQLLNMLAAAARARAAAQQEGGGKRTETWDATITL